MFIRRSCLRPYLRFLLLALLLCVAPPPFCLSAGMRQQMNVWYNGLMITGIAVDEASGDVFFSDAANRRVVHQSIDGTLVHAYQSTFVSPMQLVYHDGKLYVADSTSNKVGIIDVKAQTVSFSSTSPYLNSVSALTFNSGTGELLTVDGWGLATMVWSPDDEWRESVQLSFAEMPNYLSSATVRSFDDEVWVMDPTTLYTYAVTGLSVAMSFGSPVAGSLVLQFNSHNGTDEFYILSQAAPDGPMLIVLIGDGGVLLRNWTTPGKGGASIAFYGSAMYVD